RSPDARRSRPPNCSVSRRRRSRATTAASSAASPDMPGNPKRSPANCARRSTETMGISFPGESLQYRAARDRLLEQETDLRRAMEAVAAARRELPPGGPVPQDYVFESLRADAAPIQVR